MPWADIRIDATRKHKKTYQNIRKQINPNIENLTGKGRILSTSFQNQIVQRIDRKLTSIMILRLVRAHPTREINTIKAMQTDFMVQLGQNVSYWLSSYIGKGTFLMSKKETHGERAREVYKITPKKTQFFGAHHELLKKQLNCGTSRKVQEND